MNGEQVVLSVSDFVALVNQTFEYAFNSIVITGELANFRISKNKWVYFDLKDEFASVRFFGTVYALPGPLEDGMLLEVRGSPRLHPQFGFSVTVQSMRPAGEGSIKKAANLLEAKLRQEGLFDDARKRMLPYPPATVGLVTSKESAAYADFVKILNQRWGGIGIQLIDVQVQGESAPEQIVRAIEQFNQSAIQPEVLVVIRGGGSADDLQAFSTEQVTRAVAASRIPTLVAIGHEVDVSLAELAADVRASTPSNAAEMLVPDRKDVLRALQLQAAELANITERVLRDHRESLVAMFEMSTKLTDDNLQNARRNLDHKKNLADILSPEAPLHRGYAIVRDTSGKIVSSGRKLQTGAIVNMQFIDTNAEAEIKRIKLRKDS
ncbi:MAG TPA: exodeoxyribonuclease VII large subunit [Candidatus Saccharimonadales bacterium]|nr:exodeoxyribonuclease VII large subunit [Candidatus Saccharimonadales bacterium]